VRDPPNTALIVLRAVEFAQRLAKARKERGLTQQALAERASVHVSQIRRYEAGDAAPTLEALRKLALALSVSSDSLLFDEHERGPDDELALQFEATKALSEDEKTIVKRFLEGVLLAHEARRWAA
jgi:transcriptional regulator with XRE-family HTH domain